MYVKQDMFGILVHAVVKTENIQLVLWMIQQLHVMKLQNHTMKTRTKHIMKSNDEKKAIPTNFHTLEKLIKIST